MPRQKKRRRSRANQNPSSTGMPGRSATAYTAIRLSSLVLEKRALEVYSTDEDLLEQVLGIFKQATQQLYALDTSEYGGCNYPLQWCPETQLCQVACGYDSYDALKAKKGK